MLPALHSSGCRSHRWTQISPAPPSWCCCWDLPDGWLQHFSPLCPQHNVQQVHLLVSLHQVVPLELSMVILSCLWRRVLLWPQSVQSNRTSPALPVTISAIWLWCSIYTLPAIIWQLREIVSGCTLDHVWCGRSWSDRKKPAGTWLSSEGVKCWFWKVYTAKYRHYGFEHTFCPYGMKKVYAKLAISLVT